MLGWKVGLARQRNRQAEVVVWLDLGNHVTLRAFCLNRSTVPWLWRLLLRMGSRPVKIGWLFDGKECADPMKNCGEPEMWVRYMGYGRGP